MKSIILSILITSAVIATPIILRCYVFPRPVEVYFDNWEAAAEPNQLVWTDAIATWPVDQNTFMQMRHDANGLPEFNVFKSRMELPIGSQRVPEPNWL